MRLYTHYDIISNLDLKMVRPLFDMKSVAAHALTAMQALQVSTVSKKFPFVRTNLAGMETAISDALSANRHEYKCNWHSASGDSTFHVLQFTDGSCLIINHDPLNHHDTRFVVPWPFACSEEDVFQDIRQIREAFMEAKPLAENKNQYRLCEAGELAYPFFARWSKMFGSESRDLHAFARNLALWVQNNLIDAGRVDIAILGRSVSMEGDVSEIEVDFRSSADDSLCDRPVVQAIAKRAKSLFQGDKPIFDLSDQFSHNGLIPTPIAFASPKNESQFWDANGPATSHEQIQIIAQMNAIFGDILSA